jgi:hypothetical protein
MHMEMRILAWEVAVLNRIMPSLIYTPMRLKYITCKRAAATVSQFFHLLVEPMVINSSVRKFDLHQWRDVSDSIQTYVIKLSVIRYKLMWSSCQWFDTNLCDQVVSDSLQTYVIKLSVIRYKLMWSSCQWFDTNLCDHVVSDMLFFLANSFHLPIKITAKEILSTAGPVLGGTGLNAVLC